MPESTTVPAADLYVHLPFRTAMDDVKGLSASNVTDWNSVFPFFLVSVVAESVVPATASTVPLPCARTMTLTANGCIVSAGTNVSGATPQAIRAKPFVEGRVGVG